MGQDMSVKGGVGQGEMVLDWIIVLTGLVEKLLYELSAIGPVT